MNYLQSAYYFILHQGKLLFVLLFYFVVYDLRVDFCQPRLSVASGKKCTHITETITKDEIASMKTATVASSSSGVGEIIVSRTIVITTRTGTSSTGTSTRKRLKRKMRRKS